MLTLRVTVRTHYGTSSWRDGWSEDSEDPTDRQQMGLQGLYSALYQTPSMSGCAPSEKADVDLGNFKG